MKLVEIKLRSTLEHAQLGSIAAAHIARAYYTMVTGAEPETEDTFTNEIELAVGEACTNAAKYNPAQEPEDYELIVCFKFEQNQLIVTVKDRNPPFDFEGVPEPDFDSVPEHGYGIHLMKSTMDDVSYTREDGWNTVTMKKRLKNLEKQL